MKHWTIGKRLMLGFALVTTLTAIIGLFSVTRLNQIRAKVDLVVTNYVPSMEIASDVDAMMREDLSLVLQHILLTNHAEIAATESRLDSNRTSINALLKSYEAMMVDDRDRQMLQAVQTSRAPFDRALEDVLNLSRSNLNQDAFALLKTKGQPLFEAYRSAVHEVNEYSAHITGNAGQENRQMVTKAKGALWITLVIAVVLAATIALGISRSVNRLLSAVAAALGDGSSQVASASGQVAASSQSLAEGSSEQAASLEETSSSLEEMASMSRRNSQSAVNAKTLAAEARQTAETGMVNTQQMTRAMDQINLSSQELRRAMEAIKESSDDIAKIIKTIDEIAFQTNILALNAAVEAARAGEAGMGFAVVADEVRNLAQRSAQAAKETAGKIEAAIAKSQDGVRVSESVNTSLQRIVENARSVETNLKAIVDKARQVDTLVAEVAAASDEQQRGVEQINIAVTQMDKLTQRNAANAEESASAAEELNAQADSMKESVAELMQLVSGQSADRSPHQIQTQSHTHVPKPTQNARATTRTTTRTAKDLNSDWTTVTPTTQSDGKAAQPQPVRDPLVNADFESAFRDERN